MYNTNVQQDIDPSFNTDGSNSVSEHNLDKPGQQTGSFSNTSQK
ncbi:unnamed protein product [Acanthoscelides obtectus]|uniref:Uncharacterized protein n=1 Tax=Acanthoscelides obtectus TaxID=200917 RepID=A0A9P0KYK8_ACAOB|nr:unnamed protein product [Acanthoscelides obtectus]CAK1628219.1 hypothetical protein AOBTE_LOCUS5080 [Acanthoscelides obtectus]